MAPATRDAAGNLRRHPRRRHSTAEAAARIQTPRPVLATSCERLGGGPAERRAPARAAWKAKGSASPPTESDIGSRVARSAVAALCPDSVPMPASGSHPAPTGAGQPTTRHPCRRVSVGAPRADERPARSPDLIRASASERQFGCRPPRRQIMWASRPPTSGAAQSRPFLRSTIRKLVGKIHSVDNGCIYGRAVLHIRVGSR